MRPLATETEPPPEITDTLQTSVKPSLLQALRTGFSVFAFLSPEERSGVQLRCPKRSSLRKLAALHGLPTSSLWRSLAVYLFYRRCPEISGYRHVGISHFSLILGVKEDSQLHFLRKAEVARWSRQQLEREIKRHRHDADSSVVRLRND